MSAAAVLALPSGLSAQAWDGTGTAPNGVATDVYLAPDGLIGGTYRLDLDLVTGTGDRINATGGIVVGALNFVFTTVGNIYLGPAITVLNSPNAGYNFSVTGLPMGGPVIYSLEQSGNNLLIFSRINTGVRNIASDVSLTQSLLSGVINRPTADLSFGDPPERACVQGGQFSAAAGRLEATGTSTNGVTSDTGRLDARHSRFLASWDYACNDGRVFDGWDGAIGFIVGYTSGEADQDVFFPAGGGVSVLSSVTHTAFEQIHAGVRATISKAGTTADMQIGFGNASFVLNETATAGYSGLGLNDTGFDADFINLTGRISHRMDTGVNGLFVVPNAGLSVTRTAASRVDFTGGETLALQAFNSVIGFAGGRIEKTIAAPAGRSTTAYFADGTYYRDFAADRTSVFTDAGGNSQTITSQGIGGYGELGLGIAHVRNLTGDGRPRQLTAGFRATTLLGENVTKGVGLSMELRLTF